MCHNVSAAKPSRAQQAHTADPVTKQTCTAQQTLLCFFIFLVCVCVCVRAQRKLFEKTVLKYCFSVFPQIAAIGGSCFKYRKRCLCALWSLGVGAAAGCPCQMRGCRVLVAMRGAAATLCALDPSAGACLVPLPVVWPRALWSLSAGTAASGGWALVPLQGAAVVALPTGILGLGFNFAFFSVFRFKCSTVLCGP